MLLGLYNFVAPTAEEAVLAGQLRREWLSRGHTLAVSDVTNAAVAITRDLVIVTRNTIHYPFEQLALKGW